MILTAETVHPGTIHAEVNSAFLSLVRYAFPGQDILLMAEAQHIGAVRACLPAADTHISFRAFRRGFVSRLFYWPYKIAGEWLRICAVIRQARKRRPELLVWTALFPTGLWLLQLLIPLLLKKQRQLILLHGELEYFNETMRRPAERALRFFLRSGLNRAGKQTRFIVFSDSIKAELSALHLRCMERVFVLPHPYDYGYDTAAGQPSKQQAPADADDVPTHTHAAASVQNREALALGTFGALGANKNVHLIFRLAENLRDLIAEGKITVHAAGKCPPEVRAGNAAGLVTLHQPDAFLPRQDFEAIIAQLDLALFFYDNTAYRFCASGAVHEAIRLGIPVLALKNNYFTWLMRQEAVGKLFDDIAGMEHFIRGVADGTRTGEVAAMRARVRHFRQANSLQAQSRGLRDIAAW